MDHSIKKLWQEQAAVSNQDTSQSELSLRNRIGARYRPPAWSPYFLVPRGYATILIKAEELWTKQ
jgi:hypothetical protein